MVLPCSSSTADGSHASDRVHGHCSFVKSEADLSRREKEVIFIARIPVAALERQMQLHEARAASVSPRDRRPVRRGTAKEAIARTST